MPFRTTSAPSILKPTGKNPVNVRGAAVRLQQQGGLATDVGKALDQVQSQIDPILQALRDPVPLPDEIVMLDPQGNLVAWIGYREGPDGKVYEGGYFSQIWIGGTDPTTAPFFSDGKSVQIGKNGWISVLDPFSAIAAWLGTQAEQPINVTGAVNNGSGLIRLTVTSHNYTTGDTVNVANVGGVPNATGQWILTVVDSNHIDLVGSTFAGAYVSGGTSQRYFAGGAFESIAVGGATQVTNAVDNGSGVVRLTSASHGLQTGWFAVSTGIGGVPGANGYFYVTVIDANTVDLQGSVFSGAYTKGGRLFSWPAAKLRAQANGDLDITNALIKLIGSGATITLDPTTGTITVAANPPGTMETVIDKGGVTVFSSTAHQNVVFIQNSSITIYNDGVLSGGLWTVNGPSVEIIPSEIALNNVSNSPTITLVGPTGAIGALSVDSVVYKVSGTPGFGVTQAVVESFTFNMGTFVTGVSGPGVSSVTTGPAVTGAVLVTKTLTFNSGLLTSDV